MAAKRKTIEDKFMGRFHDILLPEFKYLKVSLEQNISKTIWINTGEIDAERDVFTIKFVTEHRQFNSLLKEKVLGVVGFNGLPFNPEEKTYFLDKRYGDLDEKKTMLQGIIKALEEVDKKISNVLDAKEDDSFIEHAQKFNNRLETENFFVEYFPEDRKCFVVLKTRGDFFRTFSQVAERVPGEKSKVKDIPGYKEKPYLKMYVRSPCFEIKDNFYSIVKNPIIDEYDISQKNIAQKSEWVSKPENWERIQNVLISEPNEFKLVIKFDDSKQVFYFSCEKYECSVSETRDGKTTVSNRRKEFKDFLALNEVLLRAEKPTDININRGAGDCYDDSDIWFFDKDKDKDKDNYPFPTKVFLDREAYSKGKVLYLDPEKNIEELEVIKSNYLKVKEKWIKPEVEFSFPVTQVNLFRLNQDVPIPYLDVEAGKSYLLHSMTHEVKKNEDGQEVISYTAKGIEVPKSEIDNLRSYVYEQGSGINSSSYEKKTFDNLRHFLVSLNYGLDPVSIEQQMALVDKNFLDWTTTQTFKKMGLKNMLPNEDFSNFNNNGDDDVDLGSSRTFKL